MIHTAFVTALLANSSLTNIIGQQIHPVISKTELSEYLIYNQISSQPEYDQSGLVSDHKTYAFMSVSSSYDTANLISKHVRQTLELQSFSDSDTEVYKCYYSNFGSSEFDPELNTYIIVDYYTFSCDHNI